MAYSSNEGKEFFKEWLSLFTIGEDPVKSIIDIGPGAGLYGVMARGVKADLKIDCIEIFGPYVKRHALHEKYDTVIVNDVLNVYVSIGEYDLAVFGDVLEHLSHHDACLVFNHYKKRVRFIWLCLPVKPFRSWFPGYVQGPEEWEENPAGKHLYDWEYNEVIDTLGPFLWQVPFKTVVVLIAEGMK